MLTADQERQKQRMVTERVKALCKIDPYVIITLRDKQFKLEFNLKAMKAILAELDVNLLAGGKIERALLDDPNVISKLVHIGLRQHHPELTEDAVDELVSIKHYYYILEALTEALTAAFPDMTGVPKDGDPEPYREALDDKDKFGDPL